MLNYYQIEYIMATFQSYGSANADEFNLCYCVTLYAIEKRASVPKEKEAPLYHM